MSENSQEFPEKFNENSDFLKKSGVSYVRTPKALFRLRTVFGFSHTECYLALHLFSESHYKNSFYFEKSYSEICKDSGLSNRKVIDCIARMVEVGLLKVTYARRKANKYTWNVGFLSFAGSAKGSQELVNSVHKTCENGSQDDVKTVHTVLYTLFLKYILKSSYKEFFEEEGAGYWRRLPEKKKSKKSNDDGEDSPKLPKKVFVPRLDEWNLALEAVLKKKGTDVYVNAYIALKSKIRPESVDFPKSYLRSIHSDKSTHWSFKKEHGFPIHLEDDASFFEYLKIDKDFINFQKERGH